MTKSSPTSDNARDKRLYCLQLCNVLLRFVRPYRRTIVKLDKNQGIDNDRQGKNIKKLELDLYCQY